MVKTFTYLAIFPCFTGLQFLEFFIQILTCFCFSSLKVSPLNITIIFAN